MDMLERMSSITLNNYTMLCELAYMQAEKEFYEEKNEV
jgi:hypothetical protein